MKKSTVLTNIAMMLLACLPLVYMYIIWDTIPHIVPLHYNGHWKPDRMGDKSELWIPTLIVAVVSILVYFLLRNIQRIDPKRRNQPQSNVFNKLAIGLVIFLTAINFLIVISSARRSETLIKYLMFPLMGLLFAFIGNYMNNLKPNYFAGIRLPWTLSDNENWRKTHHLAGKLWFWGGVGLTIISLLLSFDIIVPVFILIILTMSIIPIIYSYRLYKNKL